MTQQIINVGNAPNSGSGDPLQVAFNKTNANFTDLYGRGLSSLSDVAVASPVAGQVLTWNATTNKWNNAAPTGGGGGSSTLAGLTDVSIAAPANGQLLTYNSTLSKWQNIPPALTTTITSPVAGQVLTYNGTAWVNGAAAAGGGSPFTAPFAVNSSTATPYFTINADGTGTLGASANNMTWTTSGFTFTSTNPAVNPITVVVPPSTTTGNWLWRIGGPGASGDSAGCSNALVVAGGTNASDYAMLVQNDGSTKTFLSLKGDGSGAIGPSPNQLVWSTTGAFTLTGTATLPGGASLTPPVTIGPPASAATCMTVVAAVNSTALAVNGAANTSGTEWLGNFLAASGSTAGFANGIQIQAGTNATDSALKVLALSGSTIVNVRGDGLTVHRYAPFIAQGSWMAQFGGGASGNATNCSNGIYVGAGTSVNDCALWVQNDGGTTTYMQILGDGTGSLGPGANAMKWDASGDLTMAAGARIVGLIFPVVYTLANVATVPIGVNFMATAPFTIPANFAASRAYAQTGPAAAQTWNIRQYVGGTAPGNLIGTLTFAINATSGVFSSSSATTLSSGDVLALIPTTDTAMAGISVNIWTTRA